MVSETSHGALVLLPSPTVPWWMLAKQSRPSTDSWVKVDQSWKLSDGWMVDKTGSQLIMANYSLSMNSGEWWRLDRGSQCLTMLDSSWFTSGPWWETVHSVISKPLAGLLSNMAVSLTAWSAAMLKARAGVCWNEKALRATCYQLKARCGSWWYQAPCWQAGGRCARNTLDERSKTLALIYLHLLRILTQLLVEVPYRESNCMRLQRISAQLGVANSYRVSQSLLQRKSAEGHGPPTQLSVRSRSTSTARNFMRKPERTRTLPNEPLGISASQGQLLGSGWIHWKHHGLWHVVVFAFWKLCIPIAKHSSCIRGISSVASHHCSWVLGANKIWLYHCNPGVALKEVVGP